MDKNGMYHHKPVINGEPSSRNGWLYTSMAKHLGLTVNMESLQNLYKRCQIDHEYFTMNRLDDKQIFPPLSIDEVIGLRSLGFKSYNKNYYFAKEPKQIDYEGIGNFLMKADPYDRNEWWRDGHFSMIPLTMRIKWGSRYYADKMDGKITNPFYMVSFCLSAIVAILDKRDRRNTRSARNILWVQLKDMNSKFLIKFIDIKKNINEYFEEGHVFRETVNG